MTDDWMHPWPKRGLRMDDSASYLCFETWNCDTKWSRERKFEKGDWFLSRWALQGTINYSRVLYFKAVISRICLFGTSIEQFISFQTPKDRRSCIVLIIRRVLHRSHTKVIFVWELLTLLLTGATSPLLLLCTMSSLLRYPLDDINNKTASSKKQRTIKHTSVIKKEEEQQGFHPAKKLAATRKSLPLPNKRAPKVDNRLEIPTKEWLTLPQSRYDIQYDLGSTTTATKSYSEMENGICMLAMVARKCPFELRMQELRHVLRSHYPSGASLIYVREIFEPSDPEFRPPSLMLKSSTIDVTTITREQIDRLRFVIVDEPCREIMISYLGYFERLYYTNVAFQVVDDFSRFKSKYSKIKESREKFIKLFCLTFTLHRFDSWMHRVERGWGRQRMVEGIAKRWKNLLYNRTPEDLGLDTKFSYPAVVALLQSFKRKVECAPTYGDPSMKFKFV